MTDSEGSRQIAFLRTVFLDRDGLLNEKMPEGQWVTCWEEFHVLPGVPEAIARLNKAGARVIVVSNQRGIALGLFSVADLEAMHQRFQEVLATKGAHVDGFYFCPHDSEGCNCRKPLPGMFEQAQRDFPEISAETSAMVGDSLADIVFGRQLGMQTVLVEGDAETRRPGTEAAVELADMRFGSLTEAVQGLLRQSFR